MNVMAVIENLTSVTALLCAVFTIVMSAIYARKRLNDIDGRIESMFDLVETLTNEVKRLKINAQIGGHGGYNISQHDQLLTAIPGFSHHFDNNGMGGDYDTGVEYIDADDAAESDADESDAYESDDDESDDDESDDDTTRINENNMKSVDYSINSGVHIDESDDNRTEDFTVLTGDITQQSMISHTETPTRSHSNSHSPISIQSSQQPQSPGSVTSQHHPVKIIDLTVMGVESEINSVSIDTDYSKMTVKELRTHVVKLGYTKDVTKLKRPGLISIINNEELM